MLKFQLISASTIPINFRVANVIREIYYKGNYSVDKLVVNKVALATYRLGDFVYLNQVYTDGDLTFGIGVYTIINKGEDYSYDCWKMVLDENGNVVSNVTIVKTEEEWKQEPHASYIPALGEYCFSRIGEISKDAPMRGVLKMGDGVHTFSELNVLSSTEFDERLKNEFVPKSQLETPVVTLTLDENMFGTRTSSKKIKLGGYINTNIKKIVINDDGVQTIESKQVNPDKVIIEVVDYNGSLLTYLEIPQDKLSGRIRFDTEEFYSMSQKNGGKAGIVHVIVHYKNEEYTDEKIYNIEFFRYVGKLMRNDVLDERTILSLKDVTYDNTCNYTAKMSLNIERCCYAYPEYLGSLNSVKDANNFEIISGFEKKRILINGIYYLVYAERNTSKINNAIYKFKR